MPRKAHYWRKSGSTQCPDTFIVFDTETYPTPCELPSRGELHRLRLGVAISYRLEKGKRTRCTETVFRTPQEFWDFVESRKTKVRTTWIIGHNLAFDLGAVRGWDRIAMDDCSWSNPIFEHGIFYVRGEMSGCPVVLCDSGNYYKCSLKSIGKAVGLPKMDMPEWSASDLKWIDYCYNDVLVTALGMDKLLEFWREHELGPWAPTIASLAFSAYRHRFMRHKILVHTDQRVIDLERDAYYGGRVDTPFIGRVPFEIVNELDFSSLYPSTYTERMPSKLITYSESVSLKQLQNTPDGYHAIADVQLKTKDLPYPFRENGRVIHPVGRYRSSLAWPELHMAMELGHVERVYRAAWYQADKIFEPFLDFFYPLKQTYQKEGNTAFTTICKYLMNALYGKTGQMSPRWMAWGEEALELIAVSNGLPKDSLKHHLAANINWGEPNEKLHLPELPQPLELRRFWGCPEVNVRRVESRDSCPSIAATVTSYARVALTLAQQDCGHREYVYSDTDSIWCSNRGMMNLIDTNNVSIDEFGKLEFKRSVAEMTIHGRKDYEYMRTIEEMEGGKKVTYTDEEGRKRAGKKLKGIRSNAKEILPGVYEQLHFPSALQQLQDRISDGVFVRKVLKHLRRNIDWCTVDDSGWTKPLIRGEMT